MKRRKNVHFNALLRFINRGRKEVDRCAEAKTYLAGCIMIGAMTEYLLMAMLRVFPDVVYRRGRKMSYRWSFKTLNEFAKIVVGSTERRSTPPSGFERIEISSTQIWYVSRKPPRITRHMLNAREDDFNKVYESIVSWVI